jgi:ribosomal protein L3 glutamine methyltransferase
MRRLPREHTFEPRIALAAGNDGLDSVRAILAAAPGYLADDGLLVVEVGNTERALMRAFPRLPFMWPDIAMGGGGVFILRAADLKER